jgi:hypothetical protein
MTFEPEYRQIKVEPLRGLVFVTGHHQVMTLPVQYRQRISEEMQRRRRERKEENTRGIPEERNTLKSLKPNTQVQ